jgi:choloylglycine hydrolase
MDLKSNLRSSPRGRVFNTTAPDGKPGMSWQAKYGYLYLDAMNVDTNLDGMNEEGLSYEALYLPGEAEYQMIPSDQDSKAISYADFGHWILGNFKTVDEVRAALPNVLVFAQKVPGLGDLIFPLHFSVFDASGKGVVIEYVHGKLTMHDNKIGVMTNVPTYDWQITNLRNYVQLKPYNPKPIVASGITFVATGQGAGMVGLPGDISPPSRFVKTAILKEVAIPAENATDVINLAEHVINNVDIMRGLAREPQNGNYTLELTQWVVFKDLTHKMFYYRTYNNMTLRAVSIAKINFTENAPRLKMALAGQPYILDMTNQFLSQQMQVQ